MIHQTVHDTDSEIELITKIIMNFGMKIKSNDEETIIRLGNYAFNQLTELAFRDPTLAHFISSYIRTIDRHPTFTIQDDGTITIEYDGPDGPDDDRLTKQWIVNRHLVPHLRTVFGVFIEKFMIYI